MLFTSYISQKKSYKYLHGIFILETKYSVWKKKKKLVLLEVYFIIGHFLKNILSPFGIGKAVPRFCGK